MSAGWPVLDWSHGLSKSSQLFSTTHLSCSQYRQLGLLDTRMKVENGVDGRSYRVCADHVRHVCQAAAAAAGEFCWCHSTWCQVALLCMPAQEWRQKPCMPMVCCCVCSFRSRAAATKCLPDATCACTTVVPKIRAPFFLALRGCYHHITFSMLAASPALHVFGHQVPISH